MSNFKKLKIKLSYFNCNTIANKTANSFLSVFYSYHSCCAVFIVKLDFVLVGSSQPTQNLSNQ